MLAIAESKLSKWHQFSCPLLHNTPKLHWQVSTCKDHDCKFNKISQVQQTLPWHQPLQSWSNWKLSKRGYGHDPLGSSWALYTALVNKNEGVGFQSVRRHVPFDVVWLHFLFGFSIFAIQSLPNLLKSFVEFTPFLGGYSPHWVDWVSVSTVNSFMSLWGSLDSIDFEGIQSFVEKIKALKTALEIDKSLTTCTQHVPLKNLMT